VSAPDALGLAADVRAHRVTAREVAVSALAGIRDRDHGLNCFTAVVEESALRDAEAVDATLAAGRDPGPLAGVPFAVKNLFDVGGLVTLAGSKINAEHGAASKDATVVARMRAAGAVLLGTLNMDEYAFGFTTENSHHGPTRNPHDPTRIAGGSSGGSAAAVAGGLVPLTLGSDTNGSIRVPASLCGVYGLKPTYGRLSRAGVALFGISFDHVGPLAASVGDLAAAYDVMQGPDPADPVCADRAVEPCLPRLDEGVGSLRIAVADGHFAARGEPEVFAAVEAVAKALDAERRVTIPENDRARAAATIITVSEGASLHMENLKTRPLDFDPMTRDRFLAGALVPAALYLRAQRFRAWYRDRVREIFRGVDVLLAPTTPFPAPRIGQDTIKVAGVEVPTRPMLGLYTQPLSFIGLPVISVPVTAADPLPLGVQLVAAPWNEAALFRVAAVLERRGTTAPHRVS
jgi:amidase/aspartyl-tRNA(Asn)/glutamyl-tRNA(Gln) amidotransferase subunit A